MNDSAEEEWTREEYPVGFRVTLSIILLLEEAGGLICNVLVLFVFHIHKKKIVGNGGSGGGSNNGQSQSDSNPFITNLTMVDLLLCCTALPLTLVLLLGSRSQKALLCFFHEASISFSSCTSAISLLVISFDRYESIVTPFKKKSAVHRKWLVLGIIWGISLVGFCCPFLTLALSNGSRFSYTNDSDHLPCFMWVEDPTGNRVYFELYYVLLYLVANIVMIICYVKIFRLAKRRINIRMTLVKVSLNVPGSNPDTSNRPSVPEPIHKMHDRTLTKMTMVIVSTFMICWGPHACTSIAIMIQGTTIVLEEIQPCCLALAYSTTILHPLIYTFMRRTFRRNLMHRLQRKFSNRDFSNKIHPLKAPIVTDRMEPIPSCSGHVDNADKQLVLHEGNFNKTLLNDSGIAT